MDAECHTVWPVAMIPYINMLPYRLLSSPPGCCWYDYVPRDSVAALSAGKVLAAAVPVGALPGLGDIVEPLGQFGIAARDYSMSVLFFSNKPFGQVSVMDRMRLTPDSATSVRLLHLLLHRHKPSPEEMLSAGGEQVGELIIGDRALKALHARRRHGDGIDRPAEENGGFPHVTDLATRWFKLYRHPFVFARWVIRRDAPSAARTVLLEWLDEFKRREEGLVARAIPIAARQLGLPENAVADYFQCVRRVLDKEALAGQALFLQEIRRKQIDILGPPNAMLTGVDKSGQRLSLQANPVAAKSGLVHDMAAEITS